MKLSLCPQRDFPEIIIPLKEVTTIGTRHVLPEQLYTKSINGQVYSDIPYTAAIILEGEQSPSRVNVYINGENVKSNVENWNAFTFVDEKCLRGDVFRDYYGYIRIEIESFGDSPECEPRRYLSDYIVVMFKATPVNLSIQRMAEYVYQQHKHFLWKNNVLPFGNVQLTDHEEKSLDTLIAILQSVIRVFEHNMAFFRTNPHTKAETTFRVDDFSKLQTITPQTLQYIAQHPDELTPSDTETGVHYNKQHFYPRHTLITNKERIRDTYENKAILGFIHEITLQTGQLIEKIDKFLSICHEESRITGGYISSAAYILHTTRYSLKTKRDELRLLKDALTEAYWIYKKFLPVEDSPVTELPMPTAIFMSIAPYRQIYDVMVQWFQHGIYDFSGEEFLLPLLINNQLYEYYALFKIAEAIKANGYLLDINQCRRYLYSVGHSNYCDTEHINTFVFTKADNATITLYFQPVVWGHNYSDVISNGISLRRSTSLSIDCNSGNNRKTRNVRPAYYIPDYILKCSDSESEAYIIVDAKLSTYETVKSYQVENLAYKYQFSIHPTSARSKILGVMILYGKSVSMRCELESIHDLYHAPNVPDFWLTSLTESDSVTSAEQMITLTKLLSLLHM